MDCPTHGEPVQETCDMDVCGHCYGESLLTEPLPRNARPGPSLESVYDPTTHRVMTRRKKD